MDTKLEITNLLTPFLNALKTVNAERKHLLDIGVSDYLHSQTEKYFYTNTFIHRSEKVEFKKIYYPIKANYKQLTTDFFQLNEIFENYSNITLIGSAGSGKTTLVKHIFFQAIETTKKIPVLIELRKLNDFDGDLEKMISEKILKTKIKPSNDTFQRALNDGVFLFLLDGYDEIFSDKKQDINRQIDLFVDSFNRNNFIITTRPGSGIESFERFYDFKVCPLTDDDIYGFVDKIVSEQERRSRIADIILNPDNNNYTEYLRNPLLLSMFIMAFESHPEIPSKKSAFYRNVFDTLYSKHDGITKNSFPREKLTKLQREEFEKILSIFSYISYSEGLFNFTEEYLSDTLVQVKDHLSLDCKIDHMIYDLQTSISILVLDGFEYSFPHRSMQEYFTALFISNLQTNDKKLAYKNLSGTVNLQSNDNGLNFWYLCYELDSIEFTRNFILPTLKKYKEMIYDESDQAILANYIEVSRSILMRRGSNRRNTEMALMRHRTIFSSLMNFCGIDIVTGIYDLPVKTDAGLQIELYLKSIDKVLSSHSINDLTIRSILIKNNLSVRLRKVIDDITSKIDFYERLIQKEKKNITSLLKKK